MSDLIDRAEAQTEIMMSKNVYMLKGEPSISVSDAVQVLRQIPSVTPQPCEDCISRQAVEEIINDIRDCVSVEGYWAILERMKKLPSVSTEKTGRWIKRESGIVLFECSVCKNGYIDQPTCMGKPMFKYCPSCGAKMEAEE